MSWTQCIAFWVWSSLSVLIQAQIPFQQWQDIDPSTDFTALPNNSLYLRWRPKFHVLSPNGHMNDPCGPMYDPLRKQYHIFYQSFPQHTQFGNTSWSHAVSSDMIYWTDVQDWRNKSMIAIPTGIYPQYDWVGAFSGGAQPVNLNGVQDGNLTLMYTGASKFPDNWQLPYAQMTEQQAIATSSDGGQTWQKYEGNPVITHVPDGWNVTGWRDPIFQILPEMDSILGVEAGSRWYMILGSGIHGGGPRIPLYTAPRDDLTNWTFQGALFEPPSNFSFGGDETRTGNWGYNFELAGIFPLREALENGGDGKTVHWFVTMGAEGIPSPTHPLNHWSLFALGSMSRRANGSAEMTITAAGVLDWGASYAFNQFYDPVKDRRINWGWIPDEELNNTGILAQGFSGSLGLPREMYTLVFSGVLAPVTGIPLGAEVWSADVDGTYTVKTLGQRPLPEVVGAIQGQRSDVHEMCVGDATFVENVNSSALHMQFQIPVVPEEGRFSVLLRASPRYEEYVNVTYIPSNATVIYDPSKSTLIPNTLRTIFTSNFRPFTFGNKTSNHTESMHWSIFVDGSLIEIFINDRYALSSRAYPSLANSTGVAFEAARGCPVTVQNITIWQTMQSIWPARPENASSPLVYDGYCQTHVCFETDRVPQGEQIYAGYKM